MYTGRAVKTVAPGLGGGCFYCGKVRIVGNGAQQAKREFSSRFGSIVDHEFGLA
jgi:hypothetical protein